MKTRKKLRPSLLEAALLTAATSSMAIGAEVAVDAAAGDITIGSGDTAWFDTTNTILSDGAGSIDLATINTLTPATGFLPGWAHTQFSFLQYTGTAVEEIPSGSKILGDAQLGTATAADVYNDNGAASTLAASQSIGLIETTSSFSINGGSALDVTLGGLMFSAGDHSINTADTGFLTSSSGQLALIANGGAAGYLVDGVVIQDSDGSTPLKLVKSGPDHLVINSANTHTGGTVVNNGRFFANNASALGTGLAQVQGDNAQIWLGAFTYENDFEITGNGWTEPAGKLGALRLSGATINGDVTLTGDSRVSPWGGATGTLNGNLIGSNNLEKTGTGTFSLAADNSATFTGKLLANQGILAGSSDGSFGAAPASPTADAITLSAGARIQGNDGTAGTDLTISANRGITLDGGDSGFNTLDTFTTTVDSTISGTGRLTHAGAGTTVVNTEVDIDGGILAAGGVLTFNDDVTTTAATRTEGGGTINFNSTNVDLNSGASGTGNNGFNLGTGTTNINLGNGAGGTMTVYDMELGNNGNQPHTMNVLAGDIRVVEDIRIGHWGGSDSTINISGGSISQPDTSTNPNSESQANFILGIDGTAVVNQSGGTVNATSLVLDGRGATGPGVDTYALTGGTLNIGKWGIRRNGTSNLLQLGGGTVGTTSSSTEPGYDWSSSWSTNVPIELTGTNGDVAFDAGDKVITLNGELGGLGGFSVEGGTLVLNNENNQIDGNIVVNGGILRSNGDSTDLAPVIVNAGGSVGAGSAATLGSATFETLDLNGGNMTFRLGEVETDEIAIFGIDGLNVTSGSTVTVLPAGQLFEGDSFPLITYDGIIAGDGFAGLTLSPLPNPHIDVSLVDNSANGSIDVSVDGFKPITWTGAVNGVWDIDTTANWELDEDTSASNFYQFDTISFLDGSANTTLTLDAGLEGSINPAAAQFFNDTDDYTLQGDGIGGGATLLMDGEASLTLLNDNSYTGDTEVTVGTLNIGDGTTGSIDSASTLIIGSGATVNLDLADGSTFGNTVDNSGDLNVNGSGAITLTSAIGGTAGVVTVNNTSGASFTGRNHTSDFVLNTGTTIINGGSFFDRLYAGGTEGSITINSGATLRTTQTHDLGAFTDYPKIFLNEGGTWLQDFEQYMNNGDLNYAGGTHIIDNNRQVRFQGGLINVAASTSGSTITSADGSTSGILLYAGADVTFDVADGDAENDLLLDVAVSRNGTDCGFAKTGAGNMLVNFSSNHDGATNIEGGTLTLAAAAEFPDSPLINVGAGAELDVTDAGFIFIGSAQTLGGEGTVDGDVDVDGTVAAGSDSGNPSSTLNITGALTLFESSTIEVGVGDWSAGAGVGYDTIVADSASFSGTALNRTTIVITEETLSNFNESDKTLTILSAPSGLTFDPALVVVDSTAFTGAGTWALEVDGNDLNLVYSGVATETAYETFASAAGLTGPDSAPDADPDFDAIPNAIEFVLGSVPTTIDTDKLPTVSEDGTNLVFTFRRSDAAAADAPVVQYGNDLQPNNWTDAVDGVDGVTIVVVDDGFGAGIDQVVVTIPQTLAAGQDAFFARLRVDVALTEVN